MTRSEVLQSKHDLQLFCKCFSYKYILKIEIAKAVVILESIFSINNNKSRRIPQPAFNGSKYFDFSEKNVFLFLKKPSVFIIRNYVFRSAAVVNEF
jgi:hypothetical protein